MFRRRRSPIFEWKMSPATPEVVERRKRNRTILKTVLAAVATVDVALGLMLIYLLFLHVPYFNLQQVDVTGMRRLSRAEVVEAAEIEDGTNLLNVNLSAITERLRRHPWIRSASVYRRLPGRLIMEIEERTPRAILAAERLYYVDEQAEFFSRILPGDPVDYPLLTGATPEELIAHGPEIREMIRLGLGLLDLMERNKSALDPSRVSEIQMNLDDGLSIRTKAGRTIVMGRGNFELKLHRYGRLKKFLTGRGQWHNARIINLDFEDRALVRSADKPHLQG